MRAVVQRVLHASVHVEKHLVSSIDRGLLILVGFSRDDTAGDADYIIQKSTGLRIFDDPGGVMNLSVQDTGGDILVVSQFTLYGDARKGKRPSYSDAMQPDTAASFYNEFIKKFETQLGRKIMAGKFGAEMNVSLTNWGPVTILLDSTKQF